MTRLAAVALAVALALPASAIAGPLHDAARAGDRDLVAKLLKGGADINAQDETGETALFAGALAGESKIVDMLLVFGADASIRNDRGMTAVHAAAWGGVPEAVSVLVGDAKFSARIDLDDHDNKFGVTPLIIAVEENHGLLVAHLIGLGADLEITERHGYTALTRAAYKGHEEIITMLLRSGAQCQEIDPAWFKDCSARKAALGK
jgi:ankyrin repeat protein